MSWPQALMSYRFVNDPDLGEFGQMEWLGLHMNLVL